MELPSISVSDLLNQYQQENIKRIKLGVTDIDGVIRGKYINLDKFKSVASSGAGFCDCVLGWDVNDQLYDNVSFTGWHTAFPDAQYRLDLESQRRLSLENNTPYFIAEFVQEDGQSGHPLCPRSLLKKVLSKGSSMGYAVNLAFEYEFFVFKETAASIREKNYRNLTPLTPGNFGYSVLRASSEADLFHQLMDFCIDLDCPIEGLHCETGPGVWEAALQVDEGLRAADKAVLFKTFSKAFFQKKDCVATFMAKWSMDYPGQSGHLHQSLVDINSGKSIFYDSAAEHSMSKVMTHYVAGVQKYMRPFLAMYAPTINSYTRLVKGAWAPTAATWGVENRTAALRVIQGSESSQRMEFRIGSADANPYLVAAASVGAGLLGIEEGLQLEDAVQGNAYENQDTLAEAFQLPTNLRDAGRLFNQSSAARSLFGDNFVDHFSATREWECREYERHVNDWQLERYFEII